jgi:hypothetical protein
VELTAIELKAILRAERPVKTPLATFPNSPIELKAISRPSDSGKGPIMSNEEFEALPDYSDVEDDLDW